MQCAAGGQARALEGPDLQAHLDKVPQWKRVDREIERTFDFKNYYQTMAFVNAAAWISHQQDHHPDMSVHYNKCVVRYSTHDAGGITLNDFICAAKMDALMATPDA
jgi:4a-hydroxytetrahydrobiopterin dehydratase